MRDFSIPPYGLGEMSKEVLRIGQMLNVPTGLENLQGFGISSLSNGIMRIASAYNIPMSGTHSLSALGNNLQSLINALRNLGVLNR